MKKQSFLSSLVSSVVLKFIGYIAGFLKHIVIAAAIGLSGQLDSFYMAMAFIGIMITTWAGALEFVAMPQLVKAESEGDDGRFRKIAGEVLAAGTCASALITLLAVVFRDPLSGLAIGFDSIQRERLSDAFIWLIPVFLLSFPLGLFGAVLRAKRLFSWFYMSEALLAVVLLVCIAVAPGHPSVLLWSMSMGVAAACMFAGILAIRHIRFDASPIGGGMAGMARQVPALMLLYGASTIFVVVDRIFASFLPEGSISALAYALILIQVFPRLMGIRESFITVAAEKADRRARVATVDDLLSLVVFLSAGSMAFIFVAGADISAVLFERGAFGATDTAMVVPAMLAFTFMIAPLFIIYPLDQIYQIERRVGMMLFRTLVGISTAIALNYVAVFVLAWGIVGLAIATTVSYWVVALLGVYGLFSLGYDISVSRHLKWAGWNGAFMVAGCGVCALLPDSGHIWNGVGAALVIGIAILAAGLLYPPSREAELITQMRTRLLGFGTS